MTERVGTVFTMAPEVINGHYTKQADLWSTGVIAYMVLAGGCRDDDIRPFDGETRREVVQHILHDKVTFKGKLWKHVSKGAKHFVSSLLVEPQKRPSASKALHSEWLVRHEALYKLATSIDEVHHLKKDAFRASVNHALIKSKEASRFKKMALMVIAYDSTLEEIQGLKEIFAEYDTDGDGIISYQEFRDAISKDRDTPHLEEKEIENVFQGLDVNKTGVIDYTEFLAATLEARGQVEVDYIAKAFDRFDIDSSGYISRENLYTLLQKSRSKDFDESIITDIFGNDEKKQISYKEFLSLFQDEQFVRVGKAVENLSPT
jgi:Ca2+-binding EF-hand superfamily protein